MCVNRVLSIAISFTWQEKKVELYRLSFEQEGTDTARREYREVLRQLGEMVLSFGIAEILLIWIMIDNIMVGS